MTRITVCLIIALIIVLPIANDSVVFADDATGSANVRIDGESFTFQLLTGFDSETDFSNPSRSRIMFEVSDWSGSTNPRRVRIIVDASRVGRYSTDDEGVYFKFIEDGGKHYDPRQGCEVEIISAYSGTDDSIFSGRVSNCLVYSLASEHRVSIDFTMRGVPKLN